MKEIFKFYFTGRPKFLEAIFSKTEAEKKKMTIVLIVLAFIFVLFLKIILYFIIPYFTEYGKFAYELVESLTGLDPITLLIIDTSKEIILFFILAFVAKFTLGKFGVKDGLLVYSISALITALSLLLSTLFDFIQTFLIFSFFSIQDSLVIFNLIFSALNFFIIIWGIVLILILYSNRLKGFLNIVKYALAYLILCFIIILIINFIFGFFYSIKGNSPDSLILKNIGKTEKNISTKTGSEETGTGEKEKIESNSGALENDKSLRKNNFYSSLSSSTSLFEPSDKKEISKNIDSKNEAEKQEENIINLNETENKNEKIEQKEEKINLEDEKESKTRDFLRKLYLSSIKKSLKTYNEKYSGYPEFLEEEKFKDILDISEFGNKISAKMGDFTTKSKCSNLETSYKKTDGGYILEACLENDTEAYILKE